MRAIIAIVALSSTASADVELWTELGVRYAATRRVDLALDGHLRFDDDVSRVGAVMPELGVRVRIRKWLRVGTSYRYEYERDGDAMLVNRHRVDLYVRLRGHLGDLRFELETRLQEQLRPGTRDPQRHVLRERLAAEWRGARPWIPSASLTVFHRLDDHRLDKLWLTIGGAHERRGRDLELFYRVEHPIRDASDPVTHIVGAAFHQGL